MRVSKAEMLAGTVRGNGGELFGIGTARGRVALVRREAGTERFVFLWTVNHSTIHQAMTEGRVEYSDERHNLGEVRGLPWRYRVSKQEKGFRIWTPEAVTPDA